MQCNSLLDPMTMRASSHCLLFSARDDLCFSPHALSSNALLHVRDLLAPLMSSAADKDLSTSSSPTSPELTFDPGVTPSEPGEGMSPHTASITCCMDSVVVDCGECGSGSDSESLACEARGHTTMCPLLVGPSERCLTSCPMRTPCKGGQKLG